MKITVYLLVAQARRARLIKAERRRGVAACAAVVREAHSARAAATQRTRRAAVGTVLVQLYVMCEAPSLFGVYGEWHTPGRGF